MNLNELKLMSYVMVFELIISFGQSVLLLLTFHCPPRPSPFGRALRPTAIVSCPPVIHLTKFNRSFAMLPE